MIQLQVLELLGKHKDVEISAKEMKSLIEMLKKEDAIEALESNSRVSNQLDSELDGIMPKIPADEQYPVRPLSESSSGKPPLEILKELPDSKTRPVSGKPVSPPPPGP